MIAGTNHRAVCAQRNTYLGDTLELDRSTQSSLFSPRDCPREYLNRRTGCPVQIKEDRIVTHASEVDDEFNKSSRLLLTSEVFDLHSTGEPLG
ncbi:hypothetical protein J6590_096237 [Homalodisca vitripennis]|nr:hypothetical protein J6590_096237 [Homalodisca vitripennis]